MKTNELVQMARGPVPTLIGALTLSRLTTTLADAYFADCGLLEIMCQSIAEGEDRHGGLSLQRMG